MKNTLLFSCTVLIVAITGCNKHDNSEARIKKMTSSRGFSTEYFYNTDGSISYFVNSDGAKTSYKFSGNTIAEQMNDSTRGMFVKSTIYLGGNGWVDSTTAQNEGNNYKTTYVHDAAGLIVESQNFAVGSMTDVSKYVVKDGNQISLTVSDSTNRPLVNRYFDYYTDKPNVISYSNHGMKFLGTDSKNLVKKIVQVRPTGDTSIAVTFKYYFDDKGRVIGKTAFDEGRHMLVDSTTFTYN